MQTRIRISLRTGAVKQQFDLKLVPGVQKVGRDDLSTEKARGGGGKKCLKSKFFENLIPLNLAIYRKQNLK